MTTHVFYRFWVTWELAIGNRQVMVYTIVFIGNVGFFVNQKCKSLPPCKRTRIIQDFQCVTILMPWNQRYATNVTPRKTGSYNAQTSLRANPPYYTITKGIVQRPPFNITVDLKLWVFCTKVHSVSVQIYRGHRTVSLYIPMLRFILFHSDRY